MEMSAHSLVRRMINWDYESNQPRYRIMEERVAMGVGFYPIPLRSPARPHYRFVLKALFEAGILIRWRHEYIAMSNSKRFPLIKPGVIPNSFKNDPLFLPICGFEQFDLNQTSRSEKSVMIVLIVMFFFISNAYETKIISLMSSKPRVNLVSTLQSILDSGTTVKAEYQLTKTFPMFESLYDSAHMHEDQLDGTSVYFVNGDVGLLLVQRMINWDYESNQPRYRIMKERFALGIAFYPIPLRSPARPHYRFVLRALFESGIMIRWRGEFIALSNPKRYPLIKPGGVNPASEILYFSDLIPACYPYGINQWSSTAWPLTYYGGYNGWYGGADKTVVQANVAKVNPWGLSPAYGYGYNNYLGATVPAAVAAKYVVVNPGSVHVAPLVGYAIN
ncbi:hypothetical protein pipiens_013336 [Culex pipiens pipiens]|uniref:Uncharacterized protein n=1 Tax=Culex pipiens pipiens TaxID=38569 RepID=A0ABD1CZ20_CULPP